MEANYLRISGYTCKVCGKKHSEDDKDGLFALHYAENFPPPEILFTPTDYEAGFKAGEKAQRDKQSVVETEAYFRGRNDVCTVSVSDILEQGRKVGIREVVEWIDIDFCVTAIGRAMHNTKHEKARNQAREQMKRLKQLKEWHIEVDGEVLK